MSLTHRQANTIVALATSLAGSYRRDRVAERELVRFLDGLIVEVHTPENQDERMGWQDLRAATGLLSKAPPASPTTPPKCPKCGDARQVWRNQITGRWTCHRAWSHTELPEPTEVTTATAQP